MSPVLSGDAHRDRQRDRRPGRARLGASGGRSLWLLATLLVALGGYVSTLQTGVNGSESPYATDVGEIQNALPRWATIHEPGYPLYSLLGSACVSVLRLAGAQPAAGAALYSALWGVATAGLLFLLGRELGAASPWAAVGAVVGSLTTSMWVDSSLAEVHTMGMAALAATLLFAARLGRRRSRRDLLALVAVLAHGTVHQRSTVLLVPAVMLLVWPSRRALLGHWASSAVVALTAPLTYLYLPLRVRQGCTWHFGDVGTLSGLLTIALDSKVSRVVSPPLGLGGWAQRAVGLAALLHEDLWWPVLLAGLVGLWLSALGARGARARGWRGGLALTLAWAPSAALALVIWEGRVSDALLAAKLPVALLAALGLGLLLDALAGRARWGLPVAAVLGPALIAAQVVANRPAVLAVTRDVTVAVEALALAERVPPGTEAHPTTLLVPWGHRYWALAYAQAYEGRLRGVTLVDHNVDVGEIAARPGRLMTPSDTLYLLPPGWWEERLGRAHLSSPAAGIVEVSAGPRGCLDGGAAGIDLGNGVRIVQARVVPAGEGLLTVRVDWQATQAVACDYAVAVHLLARDPPLGPADILAQADRSHPVDGWYPTSRWDPGEVVRDAYSLRVPAGGRPVAVRVAMYRAVGEGQFETTPWLSLPVAP